MRLPLDALDEDVTTSRNGPRDFIVLGNEDAQRAVNFHGRFAAAQAARLEDAAGRLGGDGQLEGRARRLVSAQREGASHEQRETVAKRESRSCASATRSPCDTIAPSD